MIITDEQFNAAFDKIPYPIRDFITSDSLSSVTQEVGKTYGLHADMTGILDREITNMLLGVTNPTQFVAELRSAGIAGDAITPLTRDLNEKIFVPLHERIMKEESDKSNAVADDEDGDESPATVAQPTVQLPPSTPVQTAPIIAPAYVPAPLPYSPLPVAPAPVVSAPAPMPQAPVIPPPPTSSMVAPAAAAEPEVRTMAEDMALVKSGAYHLQDRAIQAEAALTRPAPTPPPQPAPPVVRPAPAPANTPSDNRDALHAILKEYGVDPYREPTE